MTNLIDKLENKAIVTRKPRSHQPVIYYRVERELINDDDGHQLFLARRIRRDGQALQTKRMVCYKIDEDRLVGWVLVANPPWKNERKQGK